ncbi:phosphoserine phosphatase SerB [Halochromatium glycolicum]|uniref:Phosphoserine phosphatase n=1 Tax=Halochromatium glycolicum TaxID=85075 RepID=A0AAJ0U6M0_9GAMM|nr:phosphoserine phosphatase SerB [Halochromatium glycolicum]MBK1706226.1 phosphoserine phosphatase SerB [Halochromatium glycolicum]
MREIVQIDIAGPDRPGITMALTEVLARDDVAVLDIGQSVIHDTLALGMLVELPEEPAGCPVFKELLFAAHDLGLSVRFTPVDPDHYEDWVAEQGKARHILTLLGREITAAQISEVAGVVTKNGLNIEQITRLSGRVSRRSARSSRPASVQLWLKGPVADVGALHASFLELGRHLEVDIAIQEDDIFRRNRRLVCFDMDSTLIQTEVIDELAAAAGVGEQVAAITERAMRGELDFSESFRQRMALLEGLDEAVLAGIAERLPITDGAERLIRALKQLGYRVAILSGGFTYFAEHLQRRLGIDDVHANALEFENGRLTGRVIGRVVDGQRKAELLRELAEREGIRLEQVIAVGDGANDLPMLSIAGLGIAFHAKPLVKEQARHSIATVGLDGILYLIGMRERDLDALGGSAPASSQ